MLTPLKHPIKKARAIALYLAYQIIPILQVIGALLVIFNLLSSWLQVHEITHRDMLPLFDVGDFVLAYNISRA